jgi:hypothetical protein
MHARRLSCTAISVLFLLGLVGCGTTDSTSSQRSSNASEPAGNEAPPPTRPGQYAVLYKIFPDGGVCSLPNVIPTAARGSLFAAQRAGLPAKITASDDYPDLEESGGSCLEYGRFDTEAQAQTAVQTINTKMDDPQIAGGDGNAAEVHEVVNP